MSYLVSVLLMTWRLWRNVTLLLLKWNRLTVLSVSLALVMMLQWCFLGRWWGNSLKIDCWNIALDFTVVWSTASLQRLANSVAAGATVASSEVRSLERVLR